MKPFLVVSIYCFSKPCNGERSNEQSIRCLKTDSKDDYESRVINKHSLGHLLYPSKADLEKFGLKAGTRKEIGDVMGG